MLSNLSLPLMCAPMSFASSVPLAVACCGAGVIGGWQGGTVTSHAQFVDYLEALEDIGGAPPIVNMPARWGTDPRAADRIELLERYRVPLVLSSLGDPSALVERVHGWGGRVVHDVTTMKHAEKAIAAGADGLMLTCAGAGGHTGFLTPMAFVPAVRRMFGGLLIVAGGIADAHGVAASLALGGDIACMGTRFIATPESGVVEGHRAMISAVGADDIMVSAAMNGVPAHWIRPSVEQAGLDPKTLPDVRSDMPAGVKPWRDIWSAGQSAGLIDRVEPVAGLVARLKTDFEALPAVPDWRTRLAAIEAGWD
ncbi:NAD(P)H-dependent flavin oxidoreductase [Sphingopyxis granuli]|jgi:nitronate monooxygenase|uniref:NAD(P)H-dependent flavin oxidoreductase n=1 Tax=Sphingopyxis granuli TaxID=267128 RepID=UPI001BB0CC9E|nr:nitronate monooxygenase [Sphingopyxis granuli]QUM70658.1 nitronate monooxygenase [Sphingopyxis granuli]